MGFKVLRYNMEYLNGLLSKNPGLRCINLDNRKIKDLSPFVPLLEKFEFLEDLELAENELKELPGDICKLKSLMSINICDNKFEDLPKVVKVLQSFPKLKSLFISPAAAEELKTIVTSLKDLEYLNGETIRSKKPVPEEEELIAEHCAPPPHGDKTVVQLNTFKKDDLDELQSIVWSIKARMQNLGYEEAVTLEAEYDSRLASVSAELNENLADKDTLPVIKKAVELKAKYAMLDLCYTKMLSTDRDQESSDIWQMLKHGHDNVVEELLRVILGMKPEMETEVGKWKIALSKMQKEMAEVLDVSQKMQEEIKQLTKEKDGALKEFTTERKDLIARIEALEYDNKKYLDTIVRHSKNLYGTTQKFGDSPLKGGEFNSSVSFDSKKKAQTMLMPSKTSTKELSMKQLKDTIAEIYTQKVKYDKKCLESKQAKETMEQYMYTFLNQQYGLKSLIQEFASAIREGIKKYTGSDSEVLLFGKILRNEFEESFRYEIPLMKDSVHEIIKDGVRRKIKYKSEIELIECCESMCSDMQEIDEAIWKDVLKKTVRESDYQGVEQRAKNIIEEKNLTSAERAKEKATSIKKDATSIWYSDLIKVIIDFMIALHEKKIIKYQLLFKKLDTDANGILNAEEFQALASEMKIAKEEYGTLSSKIDPLGAQQMTFSECFSVLNSEKVTVELKLGKGKTTKKVMTILERFNLEVQQTNITNQHLSHLSLIHI
eukprot:TRINITY_DN265_c0_g3_i1.p1 TRINITY_DN265_c0_g3~~TRINITY_DN265_c0_g3_i1.p1  ORF type:complete len:729 (+),score=196.17 TRINITY_DN265_c0_g3_i1:38-2188(+)